MYISRLTLKNWRNFQDADVRLSTRTFLVGPNASGKSNLLDALRFLRDIVKPGGGLRQAVDDRGGVSRIRCLSARRYPDIEIAVDLSEDARAAPAWRYAIGIHQETRGQPYLRYERIWRDGKHLLERPNEHDRKDKLRLTQTDLEQIAANEPFREVARFFENVNYLHLVPQLVRHPKEFTGPGVPGDPFGRSFLERLAQTPEKTRRARLRRIEEALRQAVPQLTQLAFVSDSREGGVPHLEALYEHWRPHGARQRERDFSDGTLRLIGLLWSLQEGEAPLLLEEPELSLHAGIVRRLPSFIARAMRRRKRQVLISTHSADLLADRGIGADEVLLLRPNAEGTRVEPASDHDDVRALLDAGLSIAEAVLPLTEPPGVAKLADFA